MFSSLTQKQKEIVIDKSGKFVVRACPGSGKTYTVAARMAKLMTNWKYTNYQGIAAISFTNVAWKEIEQKLSKNFKKEIPIRHPHFLGTIDSFVNKYIFLPFGHIIMECENRPQLVGDPHGSWTAGRFERDYDKYFDKVSYGVNDELIYPKIQGTFHFGYNKIFKLDGTESQYASG